MKKFSCAFKQRFILFSTPFFLIYSSFSFGQIDTNKVDYSNQDNWAVLPGHYPKELEKFGLKRLNDSIDVFYVYPTLLTDKKDERWNVEMTDSIQHEKVLKGAIQFQASAFTEVGAVYSPYYRQAHLRSYYELEKGGE